MSHNNIQIVVQTKYLADESIIEDNQYVFAYHITIRNLGNIACRLIDRHWYISNEYEQIEEVIGDGVVGEQPYLQPSEEYSYTSGAVLATPTGSMKGYYGMLNDDHESFKAQIPKFDLLGPRTLH